MSLFVFIKKNNVMNDIYEVFETEEFKSLPLHKRFWVRLKIAFFESLTMF